MIINKKIDILDDNKKSRKGCIDIFHAFMLEGATYDGYYDIPFVPQTEFNLPSELVAYDRASSCLIRNNSFCHFYLDDQKFDGPRGIWNGISGRQHNKKGFNISKLDVFDGIITPDFSLYLDMPRAMQIWNVYRSRAVGYYLYKLGKNVIPNVRWTDEESYEFAFDGIYQHSIVAVGTLGCAKEVADRILFVNGFYEMLIRIKPRCVIIYGTIFKELKEILVKYNVNYKQFDSDISKVFRGDNDGNEKQ